MRIDTFYLIDLLNRAGDDEPTAIEELVSMGASSEPAIRQLQIRGVLEWLQIAVPAGDTREFWSCGAICRECGQSISYIAPAATKTISCPKCGGCVLCVPWQTPVATRTGPRIMGPVGKPTIFRDHAFKISADDLAPGPKALAEMLLEPEDMEAMSAFISQYVGTHGSKRTLKLLGEILGRRFA